MINFHDREQYIPIRIPNDAFVYLGLEGKTNATAVDLLTGDKRAYTFAPDALNEIVLPAWKGVVFKIK